ncbi:calponin homology domain-containing protein [Auriculariales sp. MPI-PUGE-AT-0066]|nr:calponin homology domain-containing protein [Auriculariales sp. MPI-PUGE-AT-0066]
MDSLEARSRNMQERTFCKWLNTKLEQGNYPPMSSLVRDLSDGVRLVQLMEIMGDVSLGRYNRNPRMRVQKAENVVLALDFITSRGVKLTNIGPEDIIDGNLKLILGMIWTLILRFTIADISEEGVSAKEGLLLWCQRKTAPYNEVDVQDFTYSWQDGLALCALIHCHRPDLLDYNAIDKTDRHGNTRLAFRVAQEHLGIPQLLEVEDLCDNKPDERSVMTYIASFFHAFSSMDQAETVARRVEKFAELMQSVWLSRNDYERRAKALLASIGQVQAEWRQSSISGMSYTEARAEAATFATYKGATGPKRQWATERQELGTLYGNIQTRLRTYRLREWIPPAGLLPQDIDVEWRRLEESEATRSRAINAQIRQIKEALRKAFAELANDFERQLRKLSLELAALEGSLEDQQAAAKDIQTRLSPMTSRLTAIADAEASCAAANIEENDYTVFSHADLEFELGLVAANVTKKLAFIDNQIVSRNMTNLTPAQLEQFESTFRYFDHDETNTLMLEELTGALAALGIVYSDSDMDIIYDQLVSDYGAVTYEAFINLLVDITEDQTTPEQLREAFRGLAGDKPFVTELDLRMAVLPTQAIDYLRQVMPQGVGSGVGPDGQPEAVYDYEAWLDSVF